MDHLVGRSAGLVAVTASLGAGGASAADALSGLVGRVVLATADAEHLVDRHLHERLVGLGLGGGRGGGEGENRQGRDGCDVHLEWNLSRYAIC